MVDLPTRGGARATQVVVRRVTVGTAQSFALLRIASLQEDGDVLLGDLADAKARSEADWRRSAAEETWFLAVREGDGEPVGLACLVDYPDERPRYHLEAMWVAPTARRCGAGSAVVAAVEDAVTDAGESGLGLWVLTTNDSGRRFYEALGYVPSGRTGALPDGRAEDEYVRSWTG